MGDRLATKDMSQKWRGCCAPFRGGTVYPSDDLTQYVAWVEAYLRTKWYPDSSGGLATVHQDRQTGRSPQDNRTVSW